MRSRSVKLLGHLVRLTLFAVMAYGATRYFTGTLLDEGWRPPTFFALLVLTGALSLVWRAALDVAKIARRMRA
jgi:hypothetical protein